MQISFNMLVSLVIGGKTNLNKNFFPIISVLIYIYVIFDFLNSLIIFIFIFYYK
jgi:hypothetical protein